MTPDRVLPPIRRGAEVSIGLPQALVAWVQDSGLDPERLVEGSGLRLADIAQRSEGLPWVGFARLCDQAAELCGEHGLIRLGERFFDTTIGRHLAAASDDFETPAQFYRWLAESPRHRAITCIEQRLVAHDSANMSVVMQMERGYEPCHSFALMRMGFLAAVPRSFGGPDARTQLTPIRDGFRIDIEIVDPAPWARLLARARSRWARSTRRRPSALIGELQRIHEESQQRLVELERRNESLARTQTRFQESFDKAPMAMLITEPMEGRMIRVNERFCELSGFAAEEAIGKRATELGIWPDARARDENRALRASKDGYLDGVEVRLRNRAGRELTFMVSTQPIDLDGVEHLLWQALDITDRKRAEQELASLRRHFEGLATDRGVALEQSEEKLRQSERLASIGTLAAGIAHQINNPIGSIRAAAEYALFASRDPEAGEDPQAILQEALETAVAESQRAGEIVRGILQFARGRALTRRPGDLLEVLRNALEQCSDYAEAHGAELRLGGDLDPAWVSMSRTELEQVFVNVLRNAIESGEGKVHVRVRVSRLEEAVRVVVEDDGRGLAPDALLHIFDPFHTTRLAEGGTGLGLSVAHGIIEAHEGRVTAESEIGRGLRMIVDLPLVAAPA